MTEKYPFFREEDETAQAVIGEDAIASDLNGAYQKPYAVLTQKRVYCKNEQGNVITDVSALRSVQKGFPPTQNRLTWAMSACLGLTFILICFWYFWGGGRWSERHAASEAQAAIDKYHSQEEKVLEYTESLQIYNALQAEIKQSQKELEDMDYVSILQEANAAQRRAVQLRSDLNDAKQLRADKVNTLEPLIETIQNYNTQLIELEEHLQTADKEDVAAIQSNIQWLRSYIADMEENKAVHEAEFETLDQKVTDTLTALNDFEPTLEAATEEAAKVTMIQQDIQDKQSQMNSLPLADLEAELQDFQETKEDYHAARFTLLRLAMFLPLLSVLFIAFVALLVLSLRKKAKRAAQLGLVASLLGLFCCLSAAHLPLIFLVAPVAVLVIAVLSLTKMLRGEVLLVEHLTGNFSFLLSQYPAEEIKNFADQVKRLQTEESIHA